MSLVLLIPALCLVLISIQTLYLRIKGNKFIFALKKSLKLSMLITFYNYSIVIIWYGFLRFHYPLFHSNQEPSLFEVETIPYFILFSTLLCFCFSVYAKLAGNNSNKIKYLLCLCNWNIIFTILFYLFYSVFN